jgi:crossover junction endodeoxyribonuclease RuvC
MRVLGIDPGLTRCGVGVVDVERTRTASLVHYSVIRSSPDAPIEERLLTIAQGIDQAIDEFGPAAVAVERVFAQHNLRSVMGTAQVSGLALHAAARRSIPVGMHTPSEVKASITGYGSAEKKQVQTMVARILGLAELPQPADAADALALAICHAWRGNVSLQKQAAAAGGGVSTRMAQAQASAGTRSAGLTPAQRAWRAAERSGGTSGASPRLTE